MRRWLPMVLLGVVFVASLAIAARPTADASPDARVERIASEVRCPSCKGLSAAESDAEAATAVQAFIAELVAAGRTDAEVKAELSARYGTSILLRPSSRGVSGLVWALPVVVGVLAAAGLALAVQRWRSRPLRTASDDDAVLVAKARS